MKALKAEMQVLTDYLRERNLKITPHRELILETFLEHEGHRSVEDIYRSVKGLDPRIGYTTVYRTMKILTECGLAREIDLADGITRYAYGPFGLLQTVTDPGEAVTTVVRGYTRAGASGPAPKVGATSVGENVVSTCTFSLARAVGNPSAGSESNSRMT